MMRWDDAPAAVAFEELRRRARRGRCHASYGDAITLEPRRASLASQPLSAAVA